MTISNTYSKEERFQRSTKLLVDFTDNGYAKNWSFPISERFKKALDIRLTEPVRTRKLPSGATEERKEWALTQGRSFDFRAGDVLYDSIAAHQIGRAGIAIKIISATPAQPDSNSPEGWNHGWVVFQLMRPSIDGSDFEWLHSSECTQTEFVEILKHGISVWQEAA